MFKSSQYETALKFRIKELENIICPAEQHDYALADETMHIVDVQGTTVFSSKKE